MLEPVVIVCWSLSGVEPALLKLNNDVSNLADSEIGCKADLILIDAEHTNVAAFRDFLGSLRFMKPSFIAVFHDADLVCDALLNIEQSLAYQQVSFRSQFPGRLRLRHLCRGVRTCGRATAAAGGSRSTVF
jgi:hypothetical protein